MVDPSERKTLLAAIERFNDAHDELVQAAMRVLRILDLEDREAGRPGVLSNDPAPPPKEDRQKDSRPEVAGTPVLATGKIDPKPIAQMQAKASGYTGDPCGQCGQFTLVRTGTCVRCNSCGWDTGCG